MKIRSTTFTAPLLAAAALATLTCAGAAFAQAQQNAAAGDGDGAGRQQWRREQRLALLTPDERTRLKAAHRTALQDPAVQAAKAQRDQTRKAFRQTLRAAMLKADPSIGPTLDKLRAARGQGGPVRGRMEQRLSVLNDAERAQLRAARQGAHSDPAVVAAQQQMMGATTPEDRRQAHRLMAEAMRNAMLRNDPSLGPVLDKLRQGNGNGS